MKLTPAMFNYLIFKDINMIHFGNDLSFKDVYRLYEKKY